MYTTHPIRNARASFQGFYLFHHTQQNDEGKPILQNFQVLVKVDTSEIRSWKPAESVLMIIIVQS